MMTVNEIYLSSSSWHSESFLFKSNTKKRDITSLNNRVYIHTHCDKLYFVHFVLKHDCCEVMMRDLILRHNNSLCRNIRRRSTNKAAAAYHPPLHRKYWLFRKMSAQGGGEGAARVSRELTTVSNKPNCLLNHRNHQFVKTFATRNMHTCLI